MTLRSEFPFGCLTNVKPKSLPTRTQGVPKSQAIRGHFPCQAQDAGIHKAIITWQNEALETICSCGVIVNYAPLAKTEGLLGHDLQVVDMNILEVKPERYVAVCTYCGAKQKTYKPFSTDDVLVTSLRLRHRRAC